MKTLSPLRIPLLLLLGAAACVPEEPAAGEGTTSGSFTRLFVSTGGDDANPGTREKPWKTIAKGLQSVRPGEMLIILGGVYEEEMDMPTIATSEKPIVIRGEGANKTILDLRNREFQHAVNFENGASNLTLERIGIKGRYYTRWSHGIFISDRGVNRRITLRDIKIEWENGEKDRGSGIFVHFQPDADLLVEDVEASGFSDGIYLKGSNGITVRNSRLHGNIEDGIDFNGGEDILLENNRCYGNHSNGILVHGNEKPQLGGVLRGNILRGNKNGLTLYETDGLVVERNLAHQNNEFGFFLSNGVKNSILRHNTLTANPNGALKARKRGLANILRNNILCAGHKGIAARFDQVAGLDFDFNLWNQASIVLEGQGKINGMENLRMVLGGMVNARLGNPRFRDISLSDFFLLQDSPAVDAGLDFGETFSGVAPDCGVYERP